MARHLDLEEQEQLASVKAFWNQYGNAITWALIVVLGGFAAWNGWNWWQREQAARAAGVFEELDRSIAARDLPAAAGIFKTLQDRFGGTAFAEQGGLLLAKAQVDGNQAAAAITTLGWISEHATQDEYRTVARLRLAGLLLDQKKPEEALRQLGGASAKAFEALVADRRGDALMALGKRDEARAAYQKAWASMDPKLEYRRLVDAKLVALGAAPAASAPGATQ